MQPIGVFAKTFIRTNVASVFQAVHEHGFQHIQFNMTCAGLPSLPDEIDTQTITAINTALQTYHLTISGISGTFNMAHPDKAIRADGLKRLEVLARHSKAIGSDLITLCTGTRNTTDMWTFHAENHSSEAWRDMRDTIEKAIVIAEHYDIQLGIEPESANVISDVYKARQLLNEMSSTRLKIILDPANLFEEAELPAIYTLIDTAIEYLAKDIVMLHAKDRTLQGHFTAPGKGIIPFDYFLKQIQSANVNVPVVAHGFPEQEAQEVANWWKKLNFYSQQ